MLSIYNLRKKASVISCNNYKKLSIEIEFETFRSLPDINQKVIHEQTCKIKSHCTKLLQAKICRRPISFIQSVSLVQKYNNSISGNFALEINAEPHGIYAVIVDRSVLNLICD